MMLFKLKFLTIYILEGIAVEGKKKILLKNIRYRNWLDE